MLISNSFVSNKVESLMRYEFVEALCYSSTCLNDVICVWLRIYWCLTRLDYLSSMTGVI